AGLNIRPECATRMPPRYRHDRQSIFPFSRRSIFTVATWKRRTEIATVCWQVAYDGNRGAGCGMTPSMGGESLDRAFMRARELDASLGEQLRAFADAARQ